jgi:superfamily I DNA/RNA helicase
MTALITAETLDRPTRLLAGPGTGKTAVLVDLYAELIAAGLAGRGEILVLTFSTAAAGEITRRLDSDPRLPDSYGEAWIHTFHGFCARLLREYRRNPSAWSSAASRRRSPCARRWRGWTPAAWASWDA